MATRPRSARKKKVTTENQADLEPIVLPDLSRPPTVRFSSRVAARSSSSTPAVSTSTSAAIHPSTSSAPVEPSNPTSSSHPSVGSAEQMADQVPPPSSSAAPFVIVSVSQPSVPLPVRPPIGDFYAPHHIDRQHYERYTKLDKKLISIGAIVENDCVTIDSLIEHFRYQEWDKYIQMKGIGYPYVLKCFYANISSENYSFPLKSYFTKDIIIDTDTLSRTFNIPNSGVDVFDKTLKNFEGYIDGDTKESVLSMLFKEGETNLESTAPHKMRLLPQCLARIISLNIAPTLSRSTMYHWTPVLVYCLLKKIKVNLPRLLLQTMYYSVQQPKMCLPFGKVLTKIFQLENISLDAYPSMEPRSPFHKRNLGQMQYKDYSLPITMDSVPSQVQKKDMEDVSTSRQAEAPASPHPETHSPDVQAEASIPPPPPPAHTEAQAPPVVTESTTSSVEPFVTQASSEIPPLTSSDAPPAQDASQAPSSSTTPAPDLDRPSSPFDDDDDDDDGTHKYSPLRDEDISPSPPHTSAATSSIPPSFSIPPTSTSAIPPPLFSIPHSAMPFCVAPRPTFYFEDDTSMSYDHRWLAHFSKECYYNSVNTLIADSNARAWESYFMMQAGFQALNPSIRLPTPTMRPFLPVPGPSPVMRAHQLVCLQKKAEALSQKKRAAANSSSVRPPTPPPASAPASSSSAQTTFTAPAASFSVMTTRPLGSTSTFAPVSVSSAFASLSKGLGIRPPTPPTHLSATEVPIRASPEVTLFSEIFKDNPPQDSDISLKETPPTQATPVTSPLPQAPSSAAPPTAPPAAHLVPLPAATQGTSVPHLQTTSAPTMTTEVPLKPPAAETPPATETPAPASVPATHIPSVDDAPEEPLRFKRTKKPTSHLPQKPIKKQKILVAPPPKSTGAELPSTTQSSAPSTTSSSDPPIPLPFSVEKPTTEELVNFIRSQKKS